MHTCKNNLRIPPWLRVKLPDNKNFASTGELLKDLDLNTVCQNAKCPNIFECFSKKIATFLILGQNCSRNCAFCNINSGSPEPVDKSEPKRVAQAAERLELRHAVITSVTRDDLADGGADHFALTIKEIRSINGQTSIEVLIPDFKGDEQALETVMNEHPEVLNHNVETAPELYPEIRPQADYKQSLKVLKRAKELNPEGKTKSGFMVGLGETDEQVKQILRDLYRTGCDIVTIGQYMRPSRHHPPVKRYVHPETFKKYQKIGEKIGIPHVFSAPLVRSSYDAARFVD